MSAGETMAAPSEARMSTGNPDLDTILHGGLVAHRPYLIVGPSGTGKTKLALQFLCDGARRGEKVLLVTLEEPPNEMRINHHALLPDLDLVYVFDAIPDVMRYERTPFKDIAAVRSSIAFSEVQPAIRKTPELVSVEVTFSALEQTLKTEMARRNYTRLVIDSLTALQYFCMKGIDEVVGAQTFLRFLSDLGVTTLLTVEAPVEDVEMAERLLARGEIRLFRWELEATTVRAIGVEKFRGSAHDIRLHPYRMSPSGIDINLEQTISRDSHMVVTPFLRAEGTPTESPGLVAAVPAPHPIEVPTQPPFSPPSPVATPAVVAAPAPPPQAEKAAEIRELRDDRTALHLERARAAVAQLDRPGTGASPPTPATERPAPPIADPSTRHGEPPPAPTAAEPSHSVPALPRLEVPAAPGPGSAPVTSVPVPNPETSASEPRRLPPVRARSAPQRPPLPARRAAPAGPASAPAPPVRKVAKEATRAPPPVPPSVPAPVRPAEPTSPPTEPPRTPPPAPSPEPMGTPSTPPPTVSASPKEAPPMEAVPVVQAPPPGMAYPPPTVVRVVPTAVTGAPETRRRGGTGGRRRKEPAPDGAVPAPRPKRKAPTRRKAPTVTGAQAGAPPPEAARVGEPPVAPANVAEPAPASEPKDDSKESSASPASGGGTEPSNPPPA